MERLLDRAEGLKAGGLALAIVAGGVLAANIARGRINHYLDEILEYDETAQDIDHQPIPTQSMVHQSQERGAL